MERSECQDQISQNNTNIRKYSDLYDSLKRFQGTVRGNKDSFDSSVSNKERHIGDLKANTTNCKSAQKYCAGMDRALNRVGRMYVSAAYATLLFLIEQRLHYYRTKIDMCQLENIDLNHLLEELTD